VNKPAAVLWDMDGTLVDSEKLWDVPIYEAAERLGGRLSTSDRERLIGSNMSTTVAAVIRFAGAEVTDDRIEEVSGWIRDRIVELFGGELPWRPGAREALESVRDAGVPMALVTSTERDITELALNTIGRDFFAATVCGDEVDGLNKPHPRPYELGAELLGVPPGECVAVEDSVAGSASAAAAGCVVLVVPCDMPVPAAPRSRQVDSLIGVDFAALSEAFADLRS
jgi:HAD superfamily hydrolase (TIGR01509 family)